MFVSEPEIAAESFRVETRCFDDGLLIVLAGEFDLAGAARFDQAWAAVRDAQPDRVVLDFTELQFIDSTGISSVVEVMSHEERAGRRLQASGVRDQVRRIFDLVGVLERLELVQRPPCASRWPVD